MNWVIYTNSDLPDYLRYPGFETQIDICGFDICMLWTKHRTTLIPRDIRYKYFERRKIRGCMTNLSLWFNKNPTVLPPKYLMYPTWEKDLTEIELNEETKTLVLEYQLELQWTSAVRTHAMHEKRMARIERTKHTRRTIQYLMQLGIFSLELGSSQ